MTKVDAIAKVIKGNGGSATWAEIYQKIGRYYKGAKASKSPSRNFMRSYIAFGA